MINKSSSCKCTNLNIRKFLQKEENFFFYLFSAINKMNVNPNGKQMKNCEIIQSLQKV